MRHAPDARSFRRGRTPSRPRASTHSAPPTRAHEVLVCGQSAQVALGVLDRHAVPPPSWFPDWFSQPQRPVARYDDNLRAARADTKTAPTMNTPTLGAPAGELVRRRYSFRTYRPEPIAAARQRLIAAFMAAGAMGPLGAQARFALVAAAPGDDSALRRLGTYGLHQGRDRVHRRRRAPHAARPRGLRLPAGAGDPLRHRPGPGHLPAGRHFQAEQLRGPLRRPRARREKGESPAPARRQANAEPRRCRPANAEPRRRQRRAAVYRVASPLSASTRPSRFVTVTSTPLARVRCGRSTSAHTT